MLVLNTPLQNTREWITSKVLPVFDILQRLLLGAVLARGQGRREGSDAPYKV